MSLSIHLLGAPRIERDGAPIQPPRGRKAWGLLAYLLRARRVSTRHELASLMFSDADDPLRALRWNLTELRRLLAAPELLKGNEIRLELAAGTYVDVDVLESSTWMQASEVSGLGLDLLEGMDFSSSAVFETWLLNERRHLRGAAQAVLREAALFRLAAGDSSESVNLATRLVALEPFDESYQRILISAYVAAGDNAAAEHHLRSCVELFRRELGIDPTESLTSVLEETAPSDRPENVWTEASARALLEAGRAAFKAGLVDPALECMGGAATGANLCKNPALEAAILFEHGSMLVHCGKNRHEEGARVLSRVIGLAEHIGDPLLQGRAYRELAWVELLAARYVRVEVLLNQAQALTGDDVGEKAAILFVLGMSLTEMGRYPESLDNLRSSVDLARHAGNDQHAGLALSMLGKAHLFRGEFSDARTAFDEALEIFRSQGWTRLVPWPETYLAELELAEGDLESATSLYEHAFTLACEIDDPCFKCKSEAGLGLLEAQRGHVDKALDRLQSARMWLIRTPNHTWTMACALDALCSIAIANRIPGAERWVADLEALSSRTGMRELLVHAYLHRHELGDPSALESARVLARDIDNPHLHRTLEAKAQTEAILA